MALCTATDDQWEPAIVSDGSGGAIVTWWDYRSGWNGGIYVQRVDASGAVLWTADGVALYTATGDQYNPKIASDGAEGAIVTWDEDRNSNWDIYVQRVNASGIVQWTTDGVALCVTMEHQYVPEIISDGAGGAIITWYEYRSGNTDRWRGLWSCG